MVINKLKFADDYELFDCGHLVFCFIKSRLLNSRPCNGRHGGGSSFLTQHNTFLQRLVISSFFEFVVGGRASGYAGEIWVGGGVTLRMLNYWIGAQLHLSN